MKKKKILIIHHHGKFGGSSKSISEYIIHLKHKIEFDIISPFGSTYNFFKKKKFNVIGIPGIFNLNITEIGYYFGFRKLLLIRELLYLPATIYCLLKIKNTKYDIIHLNDSNLIILAPFLNFLFNAKIICHIRTRILQKKFFFKKIILYISKKYISYFIAIDLSTFHTSFFKKKTIIIYNIYSIKNKIVKNKSKNFRIGFIGTIDLHKGIDFFYRTIIETNKLNKNIFFYIAGDYSIKNKFLSKVYNFLKIKEDVYRYIKNFHNLKNCLLLGKITNLDNFYKNIDLVCFPSRMNALGRPVIEASAYGIPSIVCLKKYYNDTIIRNKTGKVISFNDIDDFKKQILIFYNNRKKLKKYGIQAKSNFKKIHNIKTNIEKLVQLYEKD